MPGPWRWVPGYNKVRHNNPDVSSRPPPDHIREKLSSAADAIIVLDQEMSQVRSEIMDAQNAFQIQANLVADILNTIQNLYQLANKREIAKIQDEFYRIYKAEDLEQLRRFQKQLDVIAEGYRAQSC